MSKNNIRLGSHTDYESEAYECTGGFWSAFEDGNNLEDKFSEVLTFQHEMQARVAKLFDEIKHWSGGYINWREFHWHNLDWYRAMLSELYKIREAVFVMDSFEDRYINTFGDWVGSSDVS